MNLEPIATDALLLLHDIYTGYGTQTLQCFQISIKDLIRRLDRKQLRRYSQGVAPELKL